MPLSRRRRRLHELTVLAGLAALAACAPPPGPDRADGDPLVTNAPAVLSFEWSCDVDAGAWTLAATADAWTGGGRLFLGVEQRVERHTVRSVGAAPDGGADELALVLPIVSDWRDQVDGASTAARCADAVDLVFVLYDRRGDLADCLVQGDQPDWVLDTDGVPDCPEDR